MKKCPYCGKAYADEFERCLIDNELLLSPEAAASSPPSPVFETAPSVSPPTALLSDRQMQIIELVLVCTIAFGGAILTSTYSYFNIGYGSSGKSAFSWALQDFREASALGLLWYVLARRKKSFSNLGLASVWTRNDLGWSVLLRMAGSFAFKFVYGAIYFFHFTATSREMAGAQVNNMLFGGGVPLAALLFQFINPFCEELIARAYVMTEIKQLTNSVTKAILVSTVLQTSYHFYQGAPAAFAHGATFLIFSIYYAKTNRIAPVILAHLYSDVGETLGHLFRTSAF